MENLIWAKTILSVYSSIEKYILKIDSLVNNISLMPQLSVDEVTEKIIELSDRKCALINLKIVIETLISKCKPKHMRFIGLKYINGLKMQDINNVLNISPRTAFRLYSSALEDIVFNMKKLGYTSKWLYDNLKTEKWIMHEFYKEYIKDDKVNLYKQLENKNSDLGILFVNQSRSSLY